MKKTLQQCMMDEVDVQIVTCATRRGESVGITGKIIEIEDDPLNPAVHIQWTSKKSGTERTGTVVYGIRHIVLVRRWETYQSNSGSNQQPAPAAAHWHGMWSSREEAPF